MHQQINTENGEKYFFKVCHFGLQLLQLLSFWRFNDSLALIASLSNDVFRSFNALMVEKKSYYFEIIEAVYTAYSYHQVNNLSKEKIQFSVLNLKSY